MDALLEEGMPVPKKMRVTEDKYGGDSDHQSDGEAGVQPMMTKIKTVLKSECILSCCTGLGCVHIAHLQEFLAYSAHNVPVAMLVFQSTRGHEKPGKDLFIFVSRFVPQYANRNVQAEVNSLLPHTYTVVSTLVLRICGFWKNFLWYWESFGKVGNVLMYSAIGGTLVFLVRFCRLLRVPCVTMVVFVLIPELLMLACFPRSRASSDGAAS